MVPSGNETSLVGVGFLWSDVANKTAICDILFVVLRDGRFMDEVTGAGTFYMTADALQICWLQIVSRHLVFGMMQKLPVVELFSSV